MKRNVCGKRDNYSRKLYESIHFYGNLWEKGRQSGFGSPKFGIQIRQSLSLRANSLLGFRARFIFVLERWIQSEPREDYPLAPRFARAQNQTSRETQTGELARRQTVTLEGEGHFY